ncbi:MFS general substrate transporter [Coniochaeta hoffmannii]|uniref:MFS general substrate transporter n=1 Tax=Coniochaeta hoffmannii TaxID=91930 RepID=A0AA38R5S4_9PEZI|nr:MFS general substrate transporter [Coniochaeta hoffmannii]
MQPTPTAIPGTVHLVDVGDQQASSKSKNGIELIPRPSDDPEDPLNWTPARKRWAAAMMVIYTFGTGMPLTFQYSVLADITRDTGISTASLVQGTGIMFLFLGFGCLLWQPIALTYGRRGVYLISTLVTVPIMVWTAHSGSEGQWYAHRIIGGIFGAPIEALPEITIPDLFFAHERGAWMSLYVFSLFGSNFVAPLIAGWFAMAYGWKWTFYFGAMISAVAFGILFFGMEETMYFRQTLEGLEDETSEDVDSSDGPGVVGKEASSTEKTAVGSANASVISEQRGAAFAPRRTYLQHLNPFSLMPGRPSNKQMFKAMIRPLWMIFTFPNVAWAGFIYGINLSWYNVLNGTASPVLSAAPYNWSTGLVGSIYTGPIIGAAFGSIWAGIIADKITLWLARRNNGVREPEQRLWPLALTSVLSCVGLIVWGVGAQHHVHWAGLAIGLGILTFSVVAGGSMALSYNIDCFKDISGDTTSSVIIIRNTLGFAISYGITPWYTNMGLQDCFIMAGFLSLGCTATFLLMIWKGKALRARSAERYWRYAKETFKHE